VQAWRREIVAPGSVAADYRTFQLFTPDDFDRGVRTPVVLYFHGSTANDFQVVQNTSNQGANKVLNAWLHKGWAVLSLRLGTTGVVNALTDNNDSKWGNADMRAGVMDVFDWLDAHFTIPTQGPCLYTASAGGIMGLNVLMQAAAESRPVAALAMVDPVTSMRWGWSGAGRPLTLKNKIAAAYSMAGSTVVGDATWTATIDTDSGGHDPHVVDTDQFDATPIYVGASDADAVVRKDLNADLFVALLTADGWGADPELVYTEYAGSHNANAHFRPEETDPFFERALGLA
jgi:fermentation-respiration switch protein FrsA (DUF1100 family)